MQQAPDCLHGESAIQTVKPNMKTAPPAKTKTKADPIEVHIVLCGDSGQALQQAGKQ